MALLEAFRQRKIGPWVVGYAAVAWGTLQLLDFLSAHFDWHPSIVRAATVFLIVNVLTVFIIAWYHGEKGPQRPEPTEIALVALVVACASAGAWYVGRVRAQIHVDATPATVVDNSSIAVLPFKNIGGDPKNEYFSDGITEEILNAIAKVPGLRVAARTSSFAFKGKDEDARVMAAKLGVAHLLMGSVQREGDSVRVTSQLYTLSSNSAAGIDTYGGDANHLFAMEDQISKGIAEQLKRTIASGTSLAGNGTTNEKAHELYLLGLDSWSRRTPESIHKALGYFTGAVAADSMYADAHAGVALALAVLPNYDDNVAPASAFERGKVAARRALDIDQKSAAAYAALSQIAEYSDNMADGEKYALKATELNPNYATAHHWLAESLWLNGRLPEALTEANRAVSLDPLSPVILSVRGMIRATLGDYVGGILDENAALERDSTFQGAQSALIQMQLTTGKYDDALPTLRRALPPEASFVTDTLLGGLRDPARRPALLRLLRKRVVFDHVSATVVAELAGDRSFAIEEARAAQKEGFPGWAFWSTMAQLGMKSLREDPRFPAAYKWPRQ